MKNVLVDTHDVLETNVMKLTLHKDGFAEILIKNNAVYDTNDVIEGKNFCTSRLPGKKIFYLLEVEGTAFPTKEAREMAADPSHSLHRGAVAITSEILAYQLLGTLYIKINQPQTPTRFFRKREEAVKWLRELMLKE